MNQTTPRVMLLIDADNVTADVIEQAVQQVMTRHGAIHVRRAYCTAELALKQLKLFKAHSIRPIVNVSTGKNSTDIALAVDAMDLVVAERPDLVVIVSSDSDFAPLVIRLREKGCRVEGIGQEGKTGEDSKPVYDAFIDIPHRKAKAAPAKRGRASSSTSAAKPNPAPAPQPANVSVPAASSTSLAPPPAPPAASRKRASKTSSRTAAKGASATLPQAPSPPSASLAPAPSRPVTQRPSAPRAAPAPPPLLPLEVERILNALPELQDGGRLQLNLAKERLFNAGLLAKSAPSTKLFRKYPSLFALTPEAAPNKVQYLGS